LNQAFTAWALAVVLPPPPWWAQLRLHDRDYPAVFSGKILGARVGTIPIQFSDELTESRSLREALGHGAPLLAVVTDPIAWPQSAPIIALAADDKVGEIATLLQIGRHAAFRIRTRSAELGLRSPALLLPNIFSDSSRDHVLISGSFIGHRYIIRAIRAANSVERVVPQSASWGWVLVVPISQYALGATARWFTALAIFVPFGLIGFWSIQWRPSNSRSQARDTRLVLLVQLCAAISGLAVIPLVFGLSVSPWSEWAAAAVGGGIGMTLGRRARS
jgi:hypothetical protein